MPDLLLELFSEEIPARMQAKAADDLRKLVTDALVEAGLVYEGAKAFATPRRLALTVHNVPVRQPDVKEERRGPRVGAPENAIAGFLKSAGLTSIDQAKVQSDKKGDVYVAVIEKPGRAAIDVIAEIVPQVIRSFPWPKAMRWGAPAVLGVVTEAGEQIVTESGDRIVAEDWITWVRPLHSIVATFGPETEEPEIVKFQVGGIESGNVTYGHRFLAPKPIVVRRFADYLHKLEEAKVVLDPWRREQMILADAKDLALAQGYDLVEDAGLLSEVAGLVEWPVVLMGSFDEEFLTIPPEVIRSTIRNNQKCFVLRSPSSHPPLKREGRREAPGRGQDEMTPTRPAAPVDLPLSGGGDTRLAPRFILVANTEAEDGGKAIIAGNERVIRARLSDAKFFYETDLKHWREIPLEERLKKFESIVFHEKLGTMAERITRIERLAAELAPIVGADVEKAKRAARLCKADLLTEVVGEFPELQGLMGKYYALAQGEDSSVAAACEDHYKPLGPNDRVPTDPVSITVALADKIDTLVGFWAIDEKPTGSKDPYALRRAALGVTRIVQQSEARIQLHKLFELATLTLLGQAAKSPHFLFIVPVLDEDVISRLRQEALSRPYGFADESRTSPAFRAVRFDPVAWFDGKGEAWRTVDALGSGWERLRTDFEDQQLFRFSEWPGVRDDLLAFFADRLKVQLREQGARHDLVDAVFALEDQDDLLMIVRRVEALGKFLDTDDGEHLLAGTKRATNIIRIEERKDKREYTGAPDASLYQLPEERALAEAIEAAKKQSADAVAREDFEAAMAAIAPLRPRVDAFFDKVTVNVDDKALRENRLKLLNEIREATRAVADFSRIEG